MNLESQVCSLELAIKLAELGVKQQSLFCYKKIYGQGEYVYCVYQTANEILDDNLSYSAFTVAELGDMLPRYILDNEIEYYYTQLPSKHLDKWIVLYRNSFNSWDGNDQEDTNEANARAKMLIYLIENKLMEVPK